MSASVGLLVLLMACLGFGSLIAAIVQFKSLAGLQAMAIMGIAGWYSAASVTPPAEYEGVTVQIVHTPLPGGSETLAIARSPVTGKNVIWKYDGKPEDRVRAFFPDKSKPRLYLTGVPVDDSKPRLVKE